jgi:hypothetical protein
MNDHLILAIASGLLMNAMTLNVNAQDVATPALPASACVHEPPISIRYNKLLHLDSPIRIPNAYLHRRRQTGCSLFKNPEHRRLAALGREEESDASPTHNWLFCPRVHDAFLRLLRY